MQWWDIYWLQSTSQVSWCLTVSWSSLVSGLMNGKLVLRSPCVVVASRWRMLDWRGSRLIDESMDGWDGFAIFYCNKLNWRQGRKRGWVEVKRWRLFDCSKFDGDIGVVSERVGSLRIGFVCYVFVFHVLLLQDGGGGWGYDEEDMLVDGNEYKS